MDDLSQETKHELFVMLNQGEGTETVQIEHTLRTLMNEANTYMVHSKAENTVKSYRADLKHFVSWCERHQLPSLPTNEETYALYITSLAYDGLKASTIQRRMSAITRAHEMAGYESPATIKVRSVWAGIRRMHGTAETGKHPIVIELLKLLLEELPDKLIGVRDRALLLLGFAGAFRRSELVYLDAEDLSVSNDGLIVRIRKSKTDQDGQGTHIGIPYGTHAESCPVRAYLSWIEAANLESGPIFRPINRHGQIANRRLSDKAVSIIIKRYIASIGLDESLYSGHSLRSGLATTLAKLGKSERTIMAQTRHKSEAIVRRYIRMGSLFADNPVADIGL